MFCYPGLSTVFPRQMCSKPDKRIIVNHLDVRLLLPISFFYLCTLLLPPFNISGPLGELMEMCQEAGTTGVCEVAGNEWPPAEC